MRQPAWAASSAAAFGLYFVLPVTAVRRRRRQRPWPDARFTATADQGHLNALLGLLPAGAIVKAFRLDAAVQIPVEPMEDCSECRRDPCGVVVGGLELGRISGLIQSGSGPPSRSRRNRTSSATARLEVAERPTESRCAVGCPARDGQVTLEGCCDRSRFRMSIPGWASSIPQSAFKGGSADV